MKDNTITYSQGTEIVHDNRGMYISLGVILILLGILVMSTFAFIAFATMVIFGWFLIIAGVVQIIQSFFAAKSGSFFPTMLAGIVSLIVGIIIAVNPAASIATVALLLALVLMVSGVYKMVSSFTANHSMWSFFGGLLNLGIGILLWRYPINGSLAILGLFIGLWFITNGIFEIFAGVESHKIAESQKRKDTQCSFNLKR